MTTKMKSETKMLDFGKLEVGNKFYLAKPETVPETAYYTKITRDRKSTRLNSSHLKLSRMPSSA